MFELFKCPRMRADSKLVTQVSAPVRVVALVALLAALAMGAWMMTAGRGASESSDVAEPLAPVHRAEAVASNLDSHNSATAVGKPETAAAKPAPAAAKPATAVGKPAKATPTKVAVQPTAAAKKPVATKSNRTRMAVKEDAKPKLLAGAPTTIAGLLANHSVVVVLLYDAQSKVDEYSLAEAALGAKESRAGFLRVDVRNEKLARHFTNAYGVLQAPSLLVFKRPGTLSLKLNGFVDHQTVEQAALNAAQKTSAR